MLLDNEYLFETDRLKAFAYDDFTKNQIDHRSLIRRILRIMTPKVTESLPSGWQNLQTDTDAINWIKDVSKESSLLLVQLRKTKEIVGFIFLYEPATLKAPMDLRLGYLLSEDTWGHGMASELIKGLLKWCRSTGRIKTITGGVEPGNVASIKVLKKNGFMQTGLSNDGTLFYVYDFCQQ